MEKSWAAYFVVWGIAHVVLFFSGLYSASPYHFAFSAVISFAILVYFYKMIASPYQYPPRIRRDANPPVDVVERLLNKKLFVVLVFVEIALAFIFFASIVFRYPAGFLASSIALLVAFGLHGSALMSAEKHFTVLKVMALFLLITLPLLPLTIFVTSFWLFAALLISYIAFGSLLVYYTVIKTITLMPAMLVVAQKRKLMAEAKKKSFKR